MEVLYHRGAHPSAGVRVAFLRIKRSWADPQSSCCVIIGNCSRGMGIFGCWIAWCSISNAMHRCGPRFRPFIILYAIRCGRILVVPMTTPGYIPQSGDRLHAPGHSALRSINVCSLPYTYTIASVYSYRSPLLWQAVANAFLAFLGPSHLPALQYFPALVLPLHFCRFSPGCLR